MPHIGEDNDNMPAGMGLATFDWAVDGVFFIDFLHNFHVAYYSEEYDADVVVRDMIAAKYAEFWMWVDLISCIPFDTIIDLTTEMTNPTTVLAVQVIKFVRLFRLTKLSRILNVHKRMDYLQAKFGVHPAVFSLILTLLQVPCRFVL